MLDGLVILVILDILGNLGNLGNLDTNLHLNLNFYS